MFSRLIDRVKRTPVRRVRRKGMPAIRKPAQGLLVVSDMVRPVLVDYLVPS